jgi:MFS family permease
MRVPAPDAAAKRAAAAFPEIPRHLVRRAVGVLLVIAVVSGLVFNAFTLLLPKLIEERLGGDPQLLPMVGLAAFAAMLCGAATQFTVGRLIDRTTLRRVFLPISALLVPGLLAVTWAQGWLVFPFAAVVAAAIFGQVTVNETMTARYISPPLRTRMYSVRFFVGFIGAAAAAPMVAWLHERTGSLASATLVMAALASVTFLCALAFPDRREELQPELWGVAAAAAE